MQIKFHKKLEKFHFKDILHFILLSFLSFLESSGGGGVFSGWKGLVPSLGGGSCFQQTKPDYLTAMPNLNRIFLMGRLTRDPSLNSSKSGTVYCRFSLAINRRYNAQDGSQREEVEYLDVLCMGRLGEFCHNYLRKGSAAYVEGRLHVESWTDPKTKVTRKNPVVYGESVQLLGASRGASGTPSPEVSPQVEQAFAAVSPAPAPVPREGGAPARRPPAPSPQPPPGDDVF